jgi:hypothetical protein
VEDPEAITLSIEKKDEFTLTAEPGKMGKYIP